VTAATTLYLTPYKGNSIGLYASGSWSVLQTAQVSLSLAALSADTNYDIFAYNNSGTVTLEPLVWANSNPATSARATALAYQDGILIKSGDATRRYLGTIRTVAAGQSEFSFGGLSADGTEAKLFVWNYYNRLELKAFVGSSAAGWSVAAPSPNYYRAAKGSDTFRVSFVSGVPEQTVKSIYGTLIARFSAGTTAIIGIGHNATNNYVGTTAYASDTATGDFVTAIANVIPVAGFNYLSALDGGLTGGYTYGFSGSGISSGLNYQTGLNFTGEF
jgi:hypothetical protein